MPNQVHAARRRDSALGDVTDEAARQSEKTKAAAEKLTSDIDSILDEIDEVLEDNAAEFVKAFVQKGGE